MTPAWVLLRTQGGAGELALGVGRRGVRWKGCSEPSGVQAERPPAPLRKVFEEVGKESPGAEIEIFQRFWNFGHYLRFNFAGSESSEPFIHSFTHWLMDSFIQLFTQQLIRPCQVLGFGEAIEEDKHGHCPETSQSRRGDTRVYAKHSAV